MSSKPQLFFILGIPRSKTAWASVLFTSGPAFCFHEPTRLVGSMRELRVRLEAAPYQFVGCSDPNIGLVADEFLEEFAESPRVKIIRPQAESLSSLRRVGGDHAEYEILIRTCAAGLDAIPAPAVAFSDLGADESKTKAMWESLGLPAEAFDANRCRELSTLRVEFIKTRDMSPRAVRWLLGRHFRKERG